MGSDHYFTATPASPENLRTIRVTLAGRDADVVTAGGVFSPDHIDAGTAVLLANTPMPPQGGHLLDIGCGWGPVATVVEFPHYPFREAAQHLPHYGRLSWCHFVGDHIT